MQTRSVLIISTILTLGYIVFFLLACSNSGSTSCPNAHVVTFKVENRHATATCGPETLSDDVEISTNGTIVTIQYETQLMICGGGVEIEVQQAGNVLTLVESGGSREVAGDCGCFNKMDVEAQVEVCEPGSYTLVVNESEHTLDVSSISDASS